MPHLFAFSFANLLPLFTVLYASLRSNPPEHWQRYLALSFAVGAFVSLLFFLPLSRSLAVSSKQLTAGRFLLRAVCANLVVVLFVFCFTPLRFPLQLAVGTFALLVLAGTSAILAGGLRTAGRTIRQLTTDPYLWIAAFLAAGILQVRHLNQTSPGAISTLIKLRSWFAPKEVGWQLVDAFPAVEFDQPVDLREHPLRNGHYFVLERPGRVRLVLPDGTASETLNISRRVSLDPGSEDGAFGFTLHPDFASTTNTGRDFLYLHYSTLKNGFNHNRVSRFPIDRASNVAAADSEEVLIEQPHPGVRTHNGGTLQFGPDGFLYIGIGDYSGGYDSANHSQTIDKGLYAGIFRIDVNCDKKKSHPIRRPLAHGVSRLYCIPNDNPFVNREDAFEEYWALGLRNPFRFSIDAPTGDVWIGDVGQETSEEIDIARAGNNHQWSYREGNLPFTLSRFRGTPPQNILGTEAPPIFAFPHSGVDRVVVGGQVYRGSRYANLEGKYVFGEFTSASLYVLERAPDAPAARKLLARLGTFRDGIAMGISSINVNRAGEILATLMGIPGQKNGGVLFLRSATESAPAAPSAPPEPVVDASSLYQAYCVRCHGPKGDGVGEMKLDPKPRDFSDPRWQARTSDERIEKVIREGGAAVGLSAVMTPWGEILSGPQISALREYIRKFARDK